MDANRMKAFSDGVIAIIVIIMVLDLKPPQDASPAALVALWLIFLAYALSFTLVAIYWVNQHHLLHAARQVSTATLWLNVHWLFWLSLFPSLPLLWAARTERLSRSLSMPCCRSPWHSPTCCSRAA